MNYHHILQMIRDLITIAFLILSASGISIAQNDSKDCKDGVYLTYEDFKSGKKTYMGNFVRFKPTASGQMQVVFNKGSNEINYLLKKVDWWGISVADTAEYRIMNVSSRFKKKFPFKVMAKGRVTYYMTVFFSQKKKDGHKEILILDSKLTTVCHKENPDDLVYYGSLESGSVKKRREQQLELLSDNQKTLDLIDKEENEKGATNTLYPLRFIKYARFYNQQ